MVDQSVMSSSLSAPLQGYKPLLNITLQTYFIKYNIG